VKARWMIRFAPGVGEKEREEIRRAISVELTGDRRILHQQSRVKSFYRLETSFRPVFVKARFFPTLWRRLGRSFRRTKEEREFENYLALRDRRISCPEPIASARMTRGITVHSSLLLMEFLPEAMTLRRLLKEVGPGGREALLDRVAAFLSAVREKGVIHEDLQWNNLLVHSTPAGHDLVMVDALHVRCGERSPQPFARTIAWFVHFLLTEGAGSGIVDGFLDRIERRGLDQPMGRARLIAEAQRMRKSR
jgi:tRNA A-37 threonylcarbamoyl transferase component Bud32